MNISSEEKVRHIKALSEHVNYLKNQSRHLENENGNFSEQNR